MAAKSVSLEEFKNNAEKISADVADGPVFITTAGKRTLVILDADEYQRLDRQDNDAAKRAEETQRFLDLLGMPDGVGDIEFDPQRLVGLHNSNREVDFSD